MSTIYFHAEDTSFELSNQQNYVDWIFSFTESYQFECGELNFVFCSDEYLLEMNRAHLSHDYYTDIITFNYVEGRVLNGDIFISVDRVVDNAKSFHSSFEDELRRVMAHGVLHLIGFNDKTESEQNDMRDEENVCMKMFK